MLLAKQKMLSAADASIAQSKQALVVAQKQMESFRAENQLAQTTLKRQQELFTGKAITDQQLDEVKNKAQVAQASAAIAEAKIGAAEADLKGVEANRAVAAAQVD